MKGTLYKGTLYMAEKAAGGLSPKRPLDRDHEVEYVGQSGHLRGYLLENGDLIFVDRVDDQWPKRCGCGAAYANLEEWNKLPFGYAHTDEFAEQEARHCGCGSTLVILKRIINPSKE